MQNGIFRHATSLNGDDARPERVETRIFHYLVRCVDLDLLSRELFVPLCWVSLLSSTIPLSHVSKSIAKVIQDFLQANLSWSHDILQIIPQYILVIIDSCLRARGLAHRRAEGVVYFSLE